LFLPAADNQVFLDTEGTASYEQTAQASATIVSIAGLVSSLLIYNKRGVFDENCVDGLFAAANIMGQLFEAGGKAKPGIAGNPEPAYTPSRLSVTACAVNSLTTKEQSTPVCQAQAGYWVQRTCTLLSDVLSRCHLI